MSVFYIDNELMVWNKGFTADGNSPGGVKAKEDNMKRSEKMYQRIQELIYKYNDLKERGQHKKADDLWWKISSMLGDANELAEKGK